MPVTVTVDTIDFYFDFQDQRIDVPAGINTLTVYPLWQAIREAQSTAVGLSYPVIAKAEGLSVLDAVQGIATFITVTLFDNWEINSLLSGGKFVLTGGNLIRADNADPFRDNPLVTYFAFFSQSGTVTTVNTGSGVTPQDKNDIISGVWGYAGPSAFELLTEHSTAPNGSTAWEHLNAQEGGGGTSGDVYISEMVTIVDEDELNFFTDEEIDLLFSDEVDSQSLDFNDDDINDIDDDFDMVEI